MIELHGMCQHQARYLGAYTLEAEHVVNDRPVYKHETTAAYLFYANSNEWYIGSKSKMLAGKDFGHMHVTADTDSTTSCLYPHKIRAPSVWKEWDGEEWTAVKVMFARVAVPPFPAGKAPRVYMSDRHLHWTCPAP